MTLTDRWKRRLQRLRGEESHVRTDLSEFEPTLEKIKTRGRFVATLKDSILQDSARDLRREARAGAAADDLLVETFAVATETADRVLGMRPFDVQILAGVALHRGHVAEMQTGEGKTLAAVLPAVLHGLAGCGVHVLTFNDYLARRDAAWMGPVYRFLGLGVGVIQEPMSVHDRRAAYAADITYATAKEAGFDFLRMHLSRDPDRLVHRPFNFAIVDEADSILIDEARVPLVIAGQRHETRLGPQRIAGMVRRLEPDRDFRTDDDERNVFLTEAGLDRVEAELNCGSLHDDANLLLLTEVNHALHVRALLRRDVDYIVRDGRIEVVDEFTGRAVDDRRWPDGLQAALEAREDLEIQPGGRILGSIALQHFVRLYPRLGGMTATARPAAEEFSEFYDLEVVIIPPNRTCAREDLPDVVFTHRGAKLGALVSEVQRVQATGRPILVGTASVEESEALSDALANAGVACRVLNARNDEEEARIVSQAGAPDAVTISTNMAGRGTDIRLGGPDERHRDEVVRLGGLYVVGTNRHESRRIDDQLRGRAGRQGDPGSSRFFVSAEDDLMLRFGVDDWIPARKRPARQDAPIDSEAVRRGIERVQGIVEGRNFEIRRTLWEYSVLIENQRRRWYRRRSDVLLAASPPELCGRRAPERHAALVNRFGNRLVESVEREITLAHLDQAWEEHLEHVADVREGIHLVRIGGLTPLDEFSRTVRAAFDRLEEDVDRRIVSTFERAVVTADGIDPAREGLPGPSSTWTYLVNDRGPEGLHEMLVGSYTFDPISALFMGPLMVTKALRQRKKRIESRSSS